MISDGEKYLIYRDYFKEIHQIMKEIFIVYTALIQIHQKINLKNMKKHAIITIVVV